MRFSSSPTLFCHHQQCVSTGALLLHPGTLPKRDLLPLQVRPFPTHNRYPALGTASTLHVPALTVNGVSPLARVVSPSTHRIPLMLVVSLPLMRIVA